MIESGRKADGHVYQFVRQAACPEEDMKMEFPFFAMTFDGAKVECWEWNSDNE